MSNFMYSKLSVTHPYSLSKYLTVHFTLTYVRACQWHDSSIHLEHLAPCAYVSLWGSILGTVAQFAFANIHLKHKSCSGKAKIFYYFIVTGYF
jgi:hypothetical protein